MSASSQWWNLTMVPLISAVLFHLALQRKWHFVWLLIFRYAHSTILWLFVLVFAYMAGVRTSSDLAPFGATFFVAILSEIPTTLKLASKKGAANLAAIPGFPRRIRFPATILMFATVVLGGLFFWASGKAEFPITLAFLVPSLLVLLVIFLFESAREKKHV